MLDDLWMFFYFLFWSLKDKCNVRPRSPYFYSDCYLKIDTNSWRTQFMLSLILICKHFTFFFTKSCPIFFVWSLYKPVDTSWTHSAKIELDHSLDTAEGRRLPRGPSRIFLLLPGSLPVLDIEGADQEAEHVCVLLDGFGRGLASPVARLRVHLNHEGPSLGAMLTHHLLYQGFVNTKIRAPLWHPKFWKFFGGYVEMHPFLNLTLFDIGSFFGKWASIY